MAILVENERIMTTAHDRRVPPGKRMIGRVDGIRVIVRSKDDGQGFEVEQAQYQENQLK